MDKGWKKRETLQSLLEAFKKLKQSFGEGQPELHSQPGLHSQQSGGEKKKQGNLGYLSGVSRAV